MSNLLQSIKSFFHPKEIDTDREYFNRLSIEYKNKRPLYEEFCAVVYKILDTSLKESGHKYQITHRTKTLERFEEKLIRKDIAGKKYAFLGEIEDLAGIRIIFYSEKDREQFLNNIEQEMRGFNFIQKENVNKKSGYSSAHLILSFGSKRLKLSEYKKFQNLKIEVQLTSILHHVWAEIEHDFIYKDIHNLKERDPEKFEIMKQKLANVLEKHIKKASVEFEEMIHEINN